MRASRSGDWGRIDGHLLNDHVSRIPAFRAASFALKAAFIFVP
jgi:hypothetical protein